MSSHLPQQEDKAGTYMDIEVIEWLIKNRLVKGQPEGETSRVWDDILHEYFRSSEGYSTGPEMSLGNGRADLFTAHVVLDTRMNEKKFLIVECKAPGLEGQDKIWHEAKGQLERYLSAVSSNNRKFGAIAIGKYVQFYELTDGALGDFNNDSSYYLLDRQCQSISAKLAYFKANHY